MYEVLVISVLHLGGWEMMRSVEIYYLCHLPGKGGSRWYWRLRTVGGVGPASVQTLGSNSALTSTESIILYTYVLLDNNYLHILTFKATK